MDEITEGLCTRITSHQKVLVCQKKKLRNFIFIKIGVTVCASLFVVELQRKKERQSKKKENNNTNNVQRESWGKRCDNDMAAVFLFLLAASFYDFVKKKNQLFLWCI